MAPGLGEWSRDPEPLRGSPCNYLVAAGEIPGDATSLAGWESETVDAILATYGDKSSQWLSDLTHKKRPWLDARGMLGQGERGSATISHAAMAEYYSSL